MLAERGGAVWSDDLTKTRLTEPVAVDAIRFHAELVTRHKVQALPSEIEGMSEQLQVQSGRFAMITWNRATLPNFVDVKYEAGMAPYPRGPKGRVVRDGPSAVSLLGSSKVQEQAWTFLSWFVGPEPGNAGGTGFLLKARYGVPVRKSLTDYPEYVKNLLPWEDAKIYADSSTRVRVLPLVARFAEINTLWGEQFDRIIFGKATVEEAVKEFATKAEPMLTS
jgi:ABC-type glycerol-3-phosphate transport system substrate-binding protein